MIKLSSQARTRKLRSLGGLAAAIVALGGVPTFAHAQGTLVPLPHSVRHPEVTSERLTKVASDEDVVVAVSLSPRDMAGLKAYAEAVSNPHSPYYHQFLTPDQVATKFGPAQADVDATVSFLKSEGVTVTDIAKNHLVITAEASAATVTKAFQTELAYATRADGSKYRTNTSELHVPSSIAQKVVSVDGIDTSIEHRFAGHKFSKPKVAVQDATTTQFNPSLYRSFYSDLGYANGFYGQGVNIAIANWDGYRLANIPYWTTANNLPVPAAGSGTNITVVKVGTGTKTYGQGTPEGEGDLDLQAVLMAAPLANIYDYDDSTTDSAAPITTYSKISSDNIADIVSESYGWGTSSTSSKGVTTYSGATFTSAYNLHLSMTAQGITYLAATGDSGTANFGAAGTKNSKCYGYPDIDPNVLMVGGTVPTVDEVTGQRVTETSWGLATNSGGTAGGTGGIDPYDTPAHGFAFNVAPSYQTTYLPTQSATYNYRLMPDISAIAGGQNGLGDESAPDTGWALVIFYSSGTTYPLGTEIQIDGTSIASPATAGSIGAVISQMFAGVTPNTSRSNVRLGLLQPFLYENAGDPNLIYDITSGITIGNLPGTTVGTAPTIGWDYATGWGSPNFSGFLNYTASGTHLSVLHPDSALAGSGDVTLTLNGTNENPKETVTFNGTPLATTFVSATQLTAVIPAAKLTGAGTNTVAIVGQLGPGSNARPFTVDNPVPSTSSVSPTTAAIDGSAYTLTVNGTGFVNGSTVKWSGSGLPTTFVSSTQLTATVGSQFLLESGTASITVTNGAPGGGTSANSQTVTLVGNPVPTETSVSPTSAVLGGPSYTITVYGTNFIPTSTVKWSNKGLPTQFVSSTELTATVGSQFLAESGTATITVANPVPLGGYSNGISVPIVGNPVPTATSLSPTTAPLGGATFTLTVNGTGFLPTSTVKWGGKSLATTYVSATQLTATVTPGFLITPGTYSVNVTNAKPGGGVSGDVTITVQ